MTKVKDALNQEYVFTYDALGRQLSQTRAGSVMNFEYDALGNRTKRTDYIGRETNYEYDILNRLKKINYLSANNPVPTLTAVYNYDDLSRLVNATNETGTVSFTYDTRGRVKTTTDVFNHLIEYNYDAASNRTQLKLDGNVHTAYAYDVANRLTTLTDEASQNFTFGYDIANKLISKTLPNNITTTYNYDGMSRLTRLKHQSSTAVLTDNNYAYNPANQISQIAELAQTKNFTYDNVDRLTAMNNGTANENYVFDGVGNRTSSHLSTSYGYQPFNKLTSTANSNHNYDANGNMTTKSEGKDFWRYVWDYENRMVSASTRKQTVRYKYDALGRRVQRYFVGGKENTKFIYDGQDVLADDNAGVLTKYQNGLGIDDKLKVSLNGNARYFIQDHLGSTVGLTDASGNLSNSANYDSFGNSTNNLSTRYQYTGREFDNFTGLYFYRARWYDANLGRFISEDPIGFAGGDINLFGYVRNQPLIYRDSMGLFPGADILPNVAGAIGGALTAAGGTLAAAGGAVVSSPAVVAGGGFMIGYGIGYYPGQYIANHPSNPFVSGPLNPWGTPFPANPNLPRTHPLPFPNLSEKCDSKPRIIPRRTIPWEPEPPPDRDGCAEEISACVQLCEEAQYDPNMKHIWGGSRTACLKGCISERCQRGFKF